MKFNKYIDFCKTVESVPEKVQVDMTRLKTVVNVVTKGNELLDQMKKEIFYGKEIDDTKWLTGLLSINVTMNDAVDHHRMCMNHKSHVKSNLDFDVRIAHSIIGINTEAGELLEAFSAAAIPRHSGKYDPDGCISEFDTVNFGEELGDLMWYTAIGVDAGHLDFDNILQTNQTKLESRYSSGGFSADESTNRTLNDERKILEDGFDGSISEDTTIPE